MKIYLWIAVAPGEPSIVVACADLKQMEAAITTRFEATFGFVPRECCVAHTLEKMESYLLETGYTQVIQTMTVLADGTEG